MSIVLSVVFLFIFGFLWYGPLFGKTWISLMKLSPEEVSRMQAKGMKGMKWQMITSVIVYIIIASSLIYLFPRLFVVSFEGLLRTILVIWLGFTFPVYVSSVLWEGRSVKLLMFNSAYSLISISIVTAIIYYMQ